MWTNYFIFLIILAISHGELTVRMNDVKTGEIVSIKWPQKSAVIVSKPLKRMSPFLLDLLKHKLKSKIVVQKITTTLAPPNCICVPYYRCDANNTIIDDGSGIIDIRTKNFKARRCTGDLEVCCKPRKPQPTSSPMITTARSMMTGTMQTSSSTMTTGMSQTSPPATISPPIISTIPPTLPSTSPPLLPPTSSPTSLPTTSTSTMPPTSPSTIPTTIPTTMPVTPLATTEIPITLTPTQSSTSSLPSDCICVPIYLCDTEGYVITNGEGIINPRLTSLPCAAGEVCCKVRNNGLQFPTSLVSPSSNIIVPSISSEAITITTTVSSEPIMTETITFTISTDPVTSPETSSEMTSSSCVCVLPLQCDSNGYVIVSGAGHINPRFRQSLLSNNCTEAEVCCILPSNNDSSSVIFPDDPSIAIDPRANLTSEIKNHGTLKACRCVNSSSCAAGNVVDLDAAGIIDPRFRYCLPENEVCCRLSGITAMDSTTYKPNSVSRIVVVNRDKFSTEPSLDLRCGVQGPPCKPEECPTPESGQAYFGEFPWMVALLSRQANEQNVFMCGASLIHNRAILTAAHCVLNRKPGIIMARFGEYDTANSDEPYPYQESEVQAIISHPQYYSGALYNDIAVLILDKPIKYAANVKPICLPDVTMTFDAGTRCLASGWGRDAFDGQYQRVLQKIDLPLVERNECQARLRTTRLGKYFQLYATFMCAGGEENKDTCTGDGGGPLICPTASGEYIQVGIVSWGIGCGAYNVPAVYVDVTQYRLWIDQQLANYGLL